MSRATFASHPIPANEDCQSWLSVGRHKIVICKAETKNYYSNSKSKSKSQRRYYELYVVEPYQKHIKPNPEDMLSQNLKIVAIFTSDGLLFRLS